MKLLPIPRRLAGLLAASLVTALALPAMAQEVTLKAVNARQGGTHYARNFETYVQKVDAERKGLVQIDYLGRPKAIPTMEQGAALRKAVVDLSNTTMPFVAGGSPESLSVNYATVSLAEMRKNGTVDYLNKLMMEMGLCCYARTDDGVPYHICLNKQIDKADLPGLKMRIAPIYREFFTKLGASVMQVAPGEVFTALDRGVVDGYGWPLLGISFNANTWDALTPAQLEFLNKQVVGVEAMNVDMAIKDAPADLKRHADAGIQTIKLPDVEIKRMLTLAQEADWTGIMATSPRHGAELRKRMAS
jgi:TRAP-type C4-dicarboxylate transport system substrate-binding protein